MVASFTSQLPITNYQLPNMTIQELIDLLNDAGDKDLEVLIQPWSTCQRYSIQCVELEDNVEFVLYMEEPVLENTNY